MKILKKYWKLLLGLALVAAAAFLYYNVYQTELAEYETESKQLKTMITGLENSIRENNRYVDIQDELEPANAAVDASRLELYDHFPVELKEEDQIMYVLYLEKTFGTEIRFAFGKAQEITVLRDGAKLMGLTLTVNYETTYKGFQDMVNYLATDSKITSVQYATIQYDAAKDLATGTVTLLLYMLDSEDLQYLPPDVYVPDTGKDNLYD
ncbi:MAG: hypothetical protein IJ960_07755 [Oscillospiraceae bacterium]|nr:hypothetical protein [Oscillospiraceae bacterium]